MSTMAAFEWIMGFMGWLLLVWLLSLAGQILLAIAAYNDAKSRLNQDATMWGLLIGFLGLIPGIIYLCVRNNANKVRSFQCPACGTAYWSSQPACPRCSVQNPLIAAQCDPLLPMYRKRAKTMLIIAIVLMGVSILAMIIMFFSFFTMMIGIGGYNYNMY